MYLPEKGDDEKDDGQGQIKADHGDYCGETDVLPGQQHRQYYGSDCGKCGDAPYGGFFVSGVESQLPAPPMIVLIQLYLVSEEKSSVKRA